METGHPSTPAVNSGSGNRALMVYGKVAGSTPHFVSTFKKFHVTTLGKLVHMCLCHKAV